MLVVGSEKILNLPIAMNYSEIDKLKSQFDAGLFPKFIEKITIKGLRSWKNQTIDFKFPIVAFVGENGTGKSTILKCAACAYEGLSKKTNYFPADFFKETPWEKIINSKIDYSIKQGNSKVDFSFSKKTERWRANKPRPKNAVFILEISRTLPMDATAGYAKMAKLAAKEISRNDISEEYRKQLSYILGKSYENASFAITDFDNTKEVGLLRRSFGEVSQYHQGAGEDTTLDLIRILQDLPNHSLLIIDEVEASLHPKSQRRLIQFLLWFCRQKKCQIIISTHSPYILQELPKESRIMLLPGVDDINIVTGISPEFAMSKLDDMDYPELNLFVEDQDSEVWLREIINYLSTDDDLLRRIKISPVGPSNVVQMMGKLGKENRLPYDSLAYIDGDKDPLDLCIKLLGDEAPERVVFSQLKTINWANLPERFGIGAGVLFSYFEDAMTDPNHHNWTTKIGDKVRMSAKSVWEIFCNEWCKNYCDENVRNIIIQPIMDKLT